MAGWLGKRSDNVQSLQANQLIIGGIAVPVLDTGEGSDTERLLCKAHKMMLEADSRTIVLEPIGLKHVVVRSLL
jgi:hypothetical protein